jgi:hypothetical protein
MDKSFPVENVIFQGKKYISMKSKVFHAFFLEMMKYMNVSEYLINEINKRYDYAKRIKKKRIRLKKEKEALTVIYNLMIMCMR